MMEKFNNKKINKKRVSVLLIVLLLVTILIIGGLQLLTNEKIINGSKIGKNNIDGKSRLEILTLRAEKEYGWKTTKNDFTILIEKVTENYFIKQEFVQIPELTIYDSYETPSKTGKKTIEYRRIYHNNEIYKESVLGETIDVEAVPSRNYQGTTEIVREANQLMKNIVVLADTPSDFRFSIRSDEYLDVYYRGNKFLYVDREYLHFIKYPTLEEFMMVAKITGNSEDEVEANLLKDAYARIKNGEKTVISDKFWLISEGGKFKFLTPIPIRVSDEYYELIDFAAYYEKYGPLK